MDKLAKEIVIDHTSSNRPCPMNTAYKWLGTVIYHKKTNYITNPNINVLSYTKIRVLPKCIERKWEPNLPHQWYILELNGTSKKKINLSNDERRDEINFCNDKSN